MSTFTKLRTELNVACLAYVAAIIYGGLFSSQDWIIPSDPRFLAWDDIRISSRADMLANVLGYIPFGLLVCLRARLGMGRGSAIAVTVLCGGLLSLSIELVQVLVPSRDSSAVDLLMNILGTAFGAGLSLVLDPTLTPFKAFMRVRDSWFVAGVPGNLGIVAILLWIAGQLSPFIPTLDVATVRAGLSGAWHTLHDPALLDWYRAGNYACYLFALGSLWSTTALARTGAFWKYVAIAALVLLIKPFFLGRELAIEALIGLVVAVPLVALLRAAPMKLRAMLGVAALLAGFVIYELAPEAGDPYPFNWIPLRGEITNTLNSATGILGLVWVFFASAALTYVLAPSYQRREFALFGGIVLAVVVTVCEWWQQYVPGRHGDITTVAIAAIVWFVAWHFRERDTAWHTLPNREFD